VVIKKSASGGKVDFPRNPTNSAVCFGDSRNSQGTIATDKLFTGQRLDSTGLYYYNARYYDPSIGRFISADPTVPDANNPQGFNRYSYVANNPLKYIDPTGHGAWEETARWFQWSWWDISCKVNYAYQTLVNLSAAANSSPYVAIAMILLGGSQGVTNFKSFSFNTRPNAQAIINNVANTEFRDLATRVSTSLRGGINNFSLINLQAREWYLAAEERIPDLVKGMTKEQQAKFAFEYRNANPYG
jgi:RHS repeat-associated protein